MVINDLKIHIILNYLIIIYDFCLCVFFIIIIIFHYFRIFSKVDVPTPEIVFRRDRIAQLSCGTNHSACLSDTGVLYTFGKGKKKQT